jgi:hypothetical protein
VWIVADAGGFVTFGAGLRRPVINERLGAVFPDLRWPDRRLTVECDGRVA